MDVFLRFLFRLCFSSFCYQCLFFLFTIHVFFLSFRLLIYFPYYYSVISYLLLLSFLFYPFSFCLVSFLFHHLSSSSPSSCLVYHVLFSSSCSLLPFRLMVCFCNIIFPVSYSNYHDLFFRAFIPGWLYSPNMLILKLLHKEAAL